MAQVSRAAYASGVAGEINNNTSGDITPQDVRENFTDLADSVWWYDEITGSDTTLVSGTAGTSGDLAIWNGDGDLVDGPTPPSGDIVGTSDTQTLTGKTIDLTDNTLTGTVAEFNTALSDGDFATLAGTETLTNKTLTDPKVTNPPNTQTGTSYTLVLADWNRPVKMNNASANTLTIPPNSSVAFPIGTSIPVQRLGAGVTTIAGGTGVTVQGNGGSGSAWSADIQTRYNWATLYKADTDTWDIIGDIDTVAP